MTLFDIKRKFERGEINKWQYIDQMYEVHSQLFDYSEFLKKTDIEKISISEGNVIMTFKSSGISLLCARGDKRIATIDALNFSTYEQSELDIQMKLMENERNVLDIGANYGWYSINVAKRLSHTNIFAFEPIPSTFDFLNRNIALNNVGNIKPFNFGFAEKAGNFVLYYDPELSVNASLANVAGSKRIETVSCEIKKLDEYSSSNNLTIDFIKCDVEGAELMVFQGGKETIARDKPVIFTEMLRKWTAKFNYSPNEIIGLLHSLGYQCYVIDGANLTEFNSVDDSTIETNYIFLHKEKHSNKIKDLEK